MFGDILSDQAGGVVGSLGLLASASIGGPVGVYEPVTALRQISREGIANPLGAILSVAMLLRYSFELEQEATCIECAVSAVLNQGYRTADLVKAGERPTPTSEMGHQVVEAVKEVAAAAKRKSA